MGVVEDYIKEIRIELAEYATEYTIGYFRLSWRGKGWAILKDESDSFVYNKRSQRFILEPMPSNRDDEFFDDCRFHLLEAKRIVEKLNVTRGI